MSSPTPLSLDPLVNPIPRIYRLFDRPGLVAQDSRHFLGLGGLRLGEFGGAQARDLVRFLRTCTLPYLQTCRLRLRGRPLIDFRAGPAANWFDWEVIADLADDLLGDECLEILKRWQRLLDRYLDDGYWPIAGEPELDCLEVLPQLAVCESKERPFTLEISLDKDGLVEEFLLPALPGSPRAVSARLWYDLESMGKSYADFQEFLADARAKEPLVVFFFKHLPSYSGAYFKVLALDGTDSRADRERRVASELGAFTPRVLARYQDLRHRHQTEIRPVERLDLPPALFLRRGDGLPGYPDHPLFAAGPWRSWLVCATMAWLAKETAAQNGITHFVLPTDHNGTFKLPLEIGLTDVRRAGESIFCALDWPGHAVLLAQYVEYATGSERLRELWASALANTVAKDFGSTTFWTTLGAVSQRFYAMLNLRDLASESFVRLEASSPAEESRRLIEELQVTHVIVHQSEPHEAYFLFPRQQALARLELAAESIPTHGALGLEHEEPTLIHAGEASAATTADVCIVIEKGRLLGFRDASLPLAPLLLTRSAATSSDAVVARIVADFPDHVALGEVVALSVSLAMDPGGLPIGTVVHVVVQPERGFALEQEGDREEGSVEISREQETLPIQVKLKATTVGPGEIRVLAFHQGQSLGTLTLTPQVTDAGRTNPQPRRHQRRLRHMPVPEQPDLALTILEHRSDDGQPAFTLRLSAADPSFGLHLKPFGPVVLQLDPQRYFEDFFKDIATLPLRRYPKLSHFC